MLCLALGGLAAVLLVLDNAWIGQPEQPPAGAQGAGAQAPGTQTPGTQSQAPEPEPVPTESPTDPSPPDRIEQTLTLIRPGIAIKREFDRFAAEHNMRLAAANTILFQQASAGPGERWAGGGDLDLLAEWVGVGKATKDTGTLNFHAEYRYQIGVQPPAELDLGTLLKTTNGFNERPMNVKELYWDQHLFEDRFRFILGRVNPEILFGGHKLQSSELYFLNQAFSVNPTVAFPQPGLAALGQVRPTPWLRVSGGIADANGSATSNDFDEFFHDHEFLEFGELAVTPTFEGLGAGRYRFALWRIDAREDAGTPGDRGFTFTFDQDLTESLVLFARFGHSDGDVIRVTDSVQAGVAVKGVLGKDSMFGAAAAWSAPKDNTLRDEKTIEVFQRFQIKDNVQLTFDAQAIFDPSNAPGDDLLGVFSVRLRVSF